MIKRFFAFLMAALLAVCALPASAEENTGYTPTNPYVLSFGGHPNDVYVFAQFSPFVPTLSYDGASVDGYSIIFGLYDEYNGQAFEKLYCTDMPVDTADLANYRRINLEDSTYAAKLANNLRAIVLSTYPHIEVEELAENSKIEGLTLGEAITGSQLAIWKTAHGDTVEVTDFLSFTTRGNSRDSEKQRLLYDEKNDYDNGDDDYKAAVKTRIEQLYNYLIALDPVDPVKKVVSESAFVEKDTQPIVTPNGDGTCNVKVTTTVDVEMTGNDKLNLTAFMAEGKYYTSVKLSNGENHCTLTIENVPAADAYGTVTLAIDGTQSGSGEDVYLIDADDIRGVSQSMIGVRSETLPVHAETKVEPDRMLNINYKKDSATGNALANISFNVYYVGSVEDYRNGKLGIGSSPTPADITKYAKSTNLVGTLTTDETGCASLNFGTEDGVYLVKELPNAAVSSSVAFFVSLPDWSRLDESGNPAYTITASPKNTVTTEDVDIKKDVTSIGNEHDTFAVGADHAWIIRTSIPKTIASGKSYVVTDTLDWRLTYQRLDKIVLTKKGNDGSSEDQTAPADEDVETLLPSTHYTVEAKKVTNENHEVDTFTVSLTTAGMKEIAALVGSDYANYELRTYFTAQINQHAAMGEEIPNQAHVEFTNNVGKTFTADSDQPEVHTGGALLKKVDASDETKVLPGATFEVYRKATYKESTAGNAELKYIQLEGETTETAMVKMEFYDNEALTGEKVTSFTTDENGVGYVYGLAYGDYYLVETEAPSGYNKLATPIKITINATSHQTENAVTVENTAGALLPSTGGPGTTAFSIGGTALMAAAVLLLLRRRKTA